jgi:MFS family permease
MQMSITSLAMRSASIDLLARAGSLDLERFNELSAQSGKQESEEVAPASKDEDERQLKQWRALAAQWFAWYQCAFLFGAAAGGLLFGRLGDRIGRSKAMAASILCYSIISGVAYFSQSPTQLLVLRFLACMGVGGIWPNGVALVSEAWSNLSRPMVAGVIGTAANVGIFLLATIAASVPITPGDWRWVMLVGAAPAVLGLFALVAVPESPRWLATRDEQSATDKPVASTAEVFRSPFLNITIIGILLATIPLIGGWGSANWMIPWAGEAGELADPPNPALKAQVGQARAFTGMLGSLMGGWIGSFVGRRRAYCLVSLAAFCCAQYAFWFTVPTDASFLYWVGALGFFSGIYFGWLPLFLPELFPTRVRSTGAGVSFNFGRILTAVTIFATGALKDVFGGDYAQIGRVTSIIYLIGMIVIWFAPDTSERQLED